MRGFLPVIKSPPHSLISFTLSTTLIQATLLDCFTAGQLPCTALLLDISLPTIRCIDASARALLAPENGVLWNDSVRFESLSYYYLDTQL
jgi:hypothetical protein